MPVRVTACEEPQLPESSLIVSWPAAGPATVGAKVTETVQFEPGTSMLGQLFVSGNPPVDEMPKMSSGLPPKFVMVTGWEGLVVPTFWEKSRVGGVKLIAEGRGLGSDRGTAP